MQVQSINLKDIRERGEVESFLEKFELKLDNDVDYTLVIKENNKIKATCSKSGKVLKCFAVDYDMRGEGVTASLISALIDKLFEEGIYHSFIFTKPENISIFSSLNYKLLYEAQGAALIENGFYTINDYLDKLIKKYSISASPKAALVMNCNPFTLGHQYLIEKASRENDEVIVFVVEEDKSVFPFEVRYRLVKEGTAHLENVKVIPGGEYIISQATFPSYFIKEENERLKAYTELDAGIFAKYFCIRLNINKRYVGTEPYCKVTNEYNETLKAVLKEYGVKLCLIERKKFEGREISASEVRKLINENNFEKLRHILPEVTMNFLNSMEGKEIIKRIKIS